MSVCCETVTFNAITDGLPRQMRAPGAAGVDFLSCEDGEICSRATRVKERQDGCSCCRRHCFLPFALPFVLTEDVALCFGGMHPSDTNALACSWCAFALFPYGGL